MIRTVKKDIDREIKEGRYIDIVGKYEADYCNRSCKRIAFSYGTYGLTGLVFVAYNGEVYATTDRNIIERFF